ncbi:MAG: dihydrolipoamide acetyltransferase family protein [Thermodesulfobacteriota bacterium]
MDVEIKIPKLGMTMKEATIVRWNKADGDWIEEKEVLLVIETEKITYEVEAPGAGYLQILEPAGKVLPVGTTVGILTSQRIGVQPGEVAAPVERPPATPSPAPRAEPVLAAPGPRIKASPLARRIARERGVDLGGLRGTGPGGRVVRADVLRFLEGRPVEALVATPRGARGVRQESPISSMRRQIMEHMHMSLQETAQMTLTREVDATGLVRLREGLCTRYEQEGLRISYNAILVKMVASAIRRHPWVNAGLAGDRLVQWDDVNIGVAMELKEGLIVPVVRNADTISILQIEKTLQDLFERARARKLLPDEIQGGTFTITNLGHLGVDAFTPILNRPESAILGLGRIVEVPVVSRQGLEPRLDFRKRMVLSLTVDHRILDGAPAARFLGELAGIIEDPLLLVG